MLKADKSQKRILKGIYSATTIKKISSFVSSYFESVFAENLTGKILSFDFIQRRFTWVAFSISRLKLTDWTLEGWI